MSTRIPFQQITIEYHVLGEFDGLTPAPVVSLDPQSPNYVKPDNRGIRVVNVPGNLGLIDPDLNGGGAQGDRCIPWVYLDTAGLGGALDAQFAVLDVVVEDGVVTPTSQFPRRFPTGGVDLFYSQKPTTVPQGSALGIVGYGAGTVKILRVNIVAPNDALEEARIKEACCCQAVPCFDTESIDTLDPTTFEVGVTARAVISGTNLFTPTPPPGPSDAFQIEDTTKDFVWIRTDGEGPAVHTEVISADPPPGTGEITLEFTFPSDGAGDYQLVGYDRYNPDCNTSDQGSPLPIINVETLACPVFALVTGDTTVAADSTDNILALTGADLGNPTTAKFTAVIQGPGGSLTVTDIAVAADGLSATITYDASPGVAGSYDLNLIPTLPPEPECDREIYSSLITVT